MAYSWQLWLSPRPTQRTKYVHNASLGDKNDGDAIRYEFPEYKGHSAVRETHYLSHERVSAGKSGPPLHIHLRQTEYFQVEQGVLGVVKNGVEYSATKDDGPVPIAPGTRHTFWAHKRSTEDLIITVWVEPQDVEHGFDESFMRNLNGYVTDCEKAKVAPSIFQIVLFMYNSDVMLTPPFWMPLWLLQGVHHVFAYWVGAYLLGYKTTYPEYSNLKH